MNSLIKLSSGSVSHTSNMCLWKYRKIELYWVIGRKMNNMLRKRACYVEKKIRSNVASENSK